jgi:predicted Rossmann-fold nucleotide-binding protein
MNGKFKERKELTVKEAAALASVEQTVEENPYYTFQEVDFTNEEVDWSNIDLERCSFLNCQMKPDDQIHVLNKGAQVLNKPKALPYEPFRASLYSFSELMEGFSIEADNSADLKIYQHFSQFRFNPPMEEALWQRIHDHSIDDALRSLLRFDENGMTKLKCVGFMGGHSTLRTDFYYKQTAIAAKLVAEAGYFVVSGGGPGIMEAANLGAYFANRPIRDLEDALMTLSMAPDYTDSAYHVKALEVIDRYPDGNASLAIPTWFYGHEPSNLFSPHIAKYFSNSIREDTLLAVCLYGVVYAPGSAGTTQEVFQEATQNHYGTFNYYSPMIFLGRERYEIQTMIYPLLKQLAWGREYYNMLHLTDQPEDVVEFLLSHPPVKKS